MTDRKTITDLYVRVCRDSGHRIGWIQAAHLVAGILKISALQVWIAVGSLDAMQRVADGTHPAAAIRTGSAS